MLINVDKEYDIHAGDRLKVFGDHMIFNCKYNGLPPVEPEDVIVVKEYDRFFLLDVWFNNGSHHYECMNKSAFYEGNCYYKKKDHDS